MSGLGALVFGLGLFFLGVQLVGEHLRKLSGASFKKALSAVDDRPWLGGISGLGFGALMQSATAVTFVVAGMVRTGLLSARGAAPVILWCNVGLTALAFLVTFDIHPLVAYVVGGAGIFFGVAKNPKWRSLAAVLLGVGLILFGLESMSEGASPLRNAVWFKELLGATVGSPLLAFAVGTVAAAVLQSNAGAVMLVIGLSGLGGFTLEQAAMLIYGTNLGAIGLRVVLAWNLDGASRRLVRLEDLFCLGGGVLMPALYFAEQAGAPLVLWLVRSVFGGDTKIGLAWLFLLSNLLPALVLSPFAGAVLHRLERVIPSDGREALAHPQFLRDAALADVEVGLQAIAQETARLFDTIEVKAKVVPVGEDGELEGDPAFNQLSGEIERFSARLSAEGRPNAAQAHQIHLLRAQLVLVRYFEESVREFDNVLATAARRPETARAAVPPERALRELVDLARSALAGPTTDNPSELRARSKRGSDFVKAAGKQAKESSDAVSITALVDAFELCTWMLHRLSKLLTERS